MHRPWAVDRARKAWGGTPQLRGGATLLGPALLSNTNVPGPFIDIPRDRRGRYPPPLEVEEPPRGGGTALHFPS